MNAIKDFLKRNLPKFEDSYTIDIVDIGYDGFSLTASNGKIFIKASNSISAIHGIYCYLKKYCNVQLSWCGNSELMLDALTMFEGEFNKKIEQKYRVYMNYCTLDYTMCWWDWSRWEKEIDFMAMNGINMPLAPIGSEAVLFETLLELGFTENEALSSISGPAFWAWQLMTNYEGYIPPSNKSYVYQRMELGRKILKRYVELGMMPIQQGFSGHVPKLLAEKFPQAKILLQKGWCQFPKTAQIDPLDPLFSKFGKIYLSKLKTLFGFYGYIACDPFHESHPPKKSKRYLNAVGTAINELYKQFDEKSVWVMQAWSLRKNIVLAVPKERLLVLDLNSEKTLANKNMWGYRVIAGMLHDFGGKNAMQGKLLKHSTNAYAKLKCGGANVVGSGIFSEAIEQNPVIYELQFDILTSCDEIELSSWLDDYITRRYGKYDDNIKWVWDILLKTCYRSDGYEENSVGSVVASRPDFYPLKAGPCCNNELHYEADMFEQATKIFADQSEKYSNSDGYQYDLCDMTRQAMSNRFQFNQRTFAAMYKSKNLVESKKIATLQLELLQDMDVLLSHRKEMSLSRWINDSHALATCNEEKKYFDFNARTLISLWGDIGGKTYNLYDYSWREWSGMISEYYSKRWEMFYDSAIKSLEQKKKLRIISGDTYQSRKWHKSYKLGKDLYKFELEWLKDYKEYPPALTTNVCLSAKGYIEKYKIGSKK